MVFRAVSRIEPLLATFCWKVHRKTKTWQFARKVASFGQINVFLCFLTKWGTFCNFFLKSSSKCKDMVVCSKSWRDLTKWMICRAFSRNEALFATFSWKVDGKAKTWLFVRKVAKFLPNPWFSCFLTNWATFCNLWLKSSSKLQNMVVCWKNHRFGQNFATFRTKYHIFAFRRTFQQKVPHFVKKHEKSSIWPKLATFRRNYNVLAFRWTFKQKVAKSCSCREKARKIIDFSKTYKFFEQTTMSWRFEDFFNKKYLISWKERKIIDWAKTLQLFEQTTNFWRLRELLSKNLKKLFHFVKKQEKSSTWPKPMQLFEQTTMS